MEGPRNAAKDAARQPAIQLAHTAHQAATISAARPSLLLRPAAAQIMGVQLDNYVPGGDEVHMRPGSSWEGVVAAEHTLVEMFRWGGLVSWHSARRALLE